MSQRGTHHSEEPPAVAIRTSPFLRFIGGFRVYPPPSFPEIIGELVNSSPTLDALEGQIREAVSSLPYDKNEALGPSTWYPYLQEVVRTLRDDAAHAYDLCAYLVALKSSGWAAARSHILEHLFPLLENQLRSRQRLLDGGTVIRKGDDYFIERDGRIVSQIIGLKTSAEEEYAYFHHEVTATYGRIAALLHLAAVYFTCLHFREHPEAYPRSVYLMFPESNHDTSFLRANWVRRESYFWRPTRWRPTSFCDEVWLGEDLLAVYAQERGVPHAEEPPRPLDDSDQAHWEEAFREFNAQYEVAIDADVRFGHDAETYFDFEGYKVRWVNGNERLAPLVILPAKHDTPWQENAGRVKRFLSQLSYRVGVGLVELSSIGTGKRFRPALGQTRVFSGRSFSDARFSEVVNPTPQQTLALAFYREAIASRSRLYSFLNFYKIVALASGDEGRIEEWMTPYLSAQYLRDFDAWNSKYVGQRPPAEFLRQANRNAIAHVGENGRLWSNDSTINPDDLEGVGIVIASESVIADLARIGMAQLIPDGRAPS